MSEKTQLQRTADALNALGRFGNLTSIPLSQHGAKIIDAGQMEDTAALLLQRAATNRERWDNETAPAHLRAPQDAQGHVHCWGPGYGEEPDWRLILDSTGQIWHSFDGLVWLLAAAEPDHEGYIPTVEGLADFDPEQYPIYQLR